MLDRFLVATCAVGCLVTIVGCSAVTSVPRGSTQKTSTATPSKSAQHEASVSSTQRRSSATTAVGTLTPEWGPNGYRNEVVVLMYHEFLTNPIPGDDITPTNLATQLSLFQQDGYHAITLQQFTRFIDGQGTVPPNAILLTFDNGYQSQYTVAFPLLEKYHDPAVLFLIASWLTPGYAPAGVQPPLTPAEVQQMVASGLVSIGTQGWDIHTAVAVAPGLTEAADIGQEYDAATGTTESLTSYEARVGTDLAHAQSALAPLAGGKLTAFAYPFGDYDPALISILHQEGFEYLFAAKLGWANIQGQSPNVLYRVNVGSWTTTPTGALSAIQTVAADTAKDPSWQPPAKSIEVWH